MKRSLKILFITVILIFLNPINACADTDSTNEILDRQSKAIGADNIYDALPSDTQKYLSQIGIDEISQNGINNLRADSFFSSLLSLASTAFKSEGIPVLTLFGIILLCALANGMRTSLSAGGQLIDIVGTVCMCSAIAVPISGLIENSTEVIKASADFCAIYLPVITGLMLSSGQSTGAWSYYTLMTAASQGASQICSRIIIPFLNIFLGISIVSSVSPQVSLSGLCNLFHKSIKWVLGFVMSVFVSLLTIQSIIGASGDTVTSKAMRFAVRSFVPVVGGALSDAYLTVQSCVRLLKSGVGIVAMIGTAFIYLPMLFKCLFWLAALNICCACAEIFGLKTGYTLFSSCTKAISALVAVILSAMLLFVVSTAIVLMVGVK